MFSGSKISVKIPRSSADKDFSSTVTSTDIGVEMATAILLFLMGHIGSLNGVSVVVLHGEIP